MFPHFLPPALKPPRHFIEYFAANIRNPNTRRAYLRAVLAFSSRCDGQNFTGILESSPSRSGLYRAAQSEVGSSR